MDNYKLVDRTFRFKGHQGLATWENIRKVNFIMTKNIIIENINIYNQLSKIKS